MFWRRLQRILRPKKPHQIANFFCLILLEERSFFIIETDANLHRHGGRAKVEGNTYFEIGEWKKNLLQTSTKRKKEVENSKKPEKTFVKLYSLHCAHFHQIEKCAGILTMTAIYLSALLSVALKKLQIDICSKSVSKNALVWLRK